MSIMFATGSAQVRIDSGPDSQEPKVIKSIVVSFALKLARNGSHMSP